MGLSHQQKTSSYSTILCTFLCTQNKNPCKSFTYKGFAFRWWCGAGSNRRHKDFQSFALPTELPHHLGIANIIKQMELDKNTVKKG